MPNVHLASQLEPADCEGFDPNTDVFTVGSTTIILTGDESAATSSSES